MTTNALQAWFWYQYFLLFGGTLGDQPLARKRRFCWVVASLVISAYADCGCAQDNQVHVVDRDVDYCKVFSSKVNVALIAKAGGSRLATRCLNGGVVLMLARAKGLEFDV